MYSKATWRLKAVCLSCFLNITLLNCVLQLLEFELPTYVCTYVHR
jgi:hypothetical protein